MGSLIFGAFILAAIPLIEARMENPMVPLSLFRSRNLSGANLTTLGVYFALNGMTFFLVIYLRNVLDLSAFAAGLTLAPVSLIMLVFSPLVGRLSGRYGSRWFMTIGPAIFAAGLLFLSRLSRGASIWSDLLRGLIVFGIGLAITVAPLTDTVIPAVSDPRSGVAAAFNNAVSRVAALVAIASLGVAFTSSYQNALNQRTQALSLSQAEQTQIERLSPNPLGGLEPRINRLK